MCLYGNDKSWGKLGELKKVPPIPNHRPFKCFPQKTYDEINSDFPSGTLSWKIVIFFFFCTRCAKRKSMIVILLLQPYFSLLFVRCRVIGVRVIDRKWNRWSVFKYQRRINKYLAGQTMRWTYKCRFVSEYIWVYNNNLFVSFTQTPAKWYLHVQTSFSVCLSISWFQGELISKAMVMFF